MDSRAILGDLRSPQLIKRQSAVRKLKKGLSISASENSKIADEIEKEMIDTLEDSKSSWQSTHGMFLAAVGLLESIKLAEKSRKIIMRKALDHLEHKEYRVRLVVGSVLQALANVDGISIYLDCKKELFESIHKNFHRDGKGVNAKVQAPKFLLPTASLLELTAEENVKTDSSIDNESFLNPSITTPSVASGGATLPNIGKLSVKPASSLRGVRKEKKSMLSKPKEETKRPSTTTRVSKPADLMRWKAELREQMHDTEGWKSLETSFNALRCIIAGSKSAFDKYVDEEFLTLLEKASIHTNRFVREITYHTTAAIAQYCGIDTLRTLAKRTCVLLAKGLSDNWSQVRYASSIATRHLLTRAQKAGFAGPYLPLLLPPMCINRYYVAQGVRIYSHESWKMAMGSRGPELVAKHIDKIVDFYVAQAGADNHAVREAACACITELALKVEKKAVSPHVKTLLDTLIDCFKDDSWPVRDAACSACGDFIQAFPKESEERIMKLYKLWFDHLKDSIPTVREGAAVSLGKALKAYGSDAENIIGPKLKSSLAAVKDQKSDSTRLGGLQNVTQFGVARRVTGKESMALSDQQMYSCGSLAPKMKKRGAGCMDHSFQRPAEPWEITDGAVYLLREISDKKPELVGSLMETAAEMVSRRHYSHHVYLKKTFWKAIPIIAKNMGKRPFKRVMEPIMEPLFETLACNHKLAAHAAADCIEALDKYLGHLIFLGRMTDDMKRKLQRASHICRVRTTR